MPECIVSYWKFLSNRPHRRIKVQKKIGVPANHALPPNNQTLHRSTVAGQRFLKHLVYYPFIAQCSQNENMEIGIY